MSIFSFGRTLRSSQRLVTILTVLARHGFGQLVVSLRLERFIPFRQKLGVRTMPGVRGEDLEVIANRATRVLEELGPTFIKLGQALASRPDLLPIEFQTAFRKLEDDVDPFPYAEVEQAVLRDLGAPIGDLFSNFDAEPVASGSIGQVHHATTAEGVKVVVKVRRPGIERLVMHDVALLRGLADLVERHIPEYRIYRAPMLVEEFNRTLRRELDFVNEASVTSRFHEEFEDNPSIQTPRVFWDLTSHNILTLERIEGLTVRSDDDIKGHGLDRKQLARNLLDAFFHQYFHMGVFHADPHPGNLLAQPPDRWGIIDFGQTGRLDDEMRSRLVICLVAATNRQLELVVDVFDDLGALPDDIDREQFTGDLAVLLDKYYGTPLKHIRIGTLFEEVVAVARQHSVVLPRDFVLLGKSLSTVGGMATRLDPECAPVQVVRPKLNRMLIERLSPNRLKQRATSHAYHLATFFQQGPQMLRRFLRKLLRGQTQIIFRHEGLANFIQELDRSSNRIAFSVVTGAIILASSILMNAKLGPFVPGTDISVLGLAGYVIAAFAGLWLLISIFRSGRL